MIARDSGRDGRDLSTVMVNRELISMNANLWWWKDDDDDDDDDMANVAAM